MGLEEAEEVREGEVPGNEMERSSDYHGVQHARGTTEISI
jgi:hypothetical protein